MGFESHLFLLHNLHTGSMAMQPALKHTHTHECKHFALKQSVLCPFGSGTLGKLFIDVGWPPQNNSCRYMDFLIINHSRHLPNTAQHIHTKRQPIRLQFPYLITPSCELRPRPALVSPTCLCFRCDRKNVEDPFCQWGWPTMAPQPVHVFGCLKNDFRTRIDRFEYCRFG